MKLTRKQKEEIIANLSTELVASKSAILINYQGLRVKEIQDFKGKLKEKGIGFKIIKNSLLKIALKNNQLDIPAELLDQPLAIVWGNADEVEPAKLTNDFHKTAENLEIVGGIVNREFADKNIILQLAALPSRQMLYAQLVGSLYAPMYRLVNALQGNLRSLVYILKQYQESKI